MTPLNTGESGIFKLQESQTIFLHNENPKSFCSITNAISNSISSVLIYKTFVLYVSLTEIWISRQKILVASQDFESLNLVTQVF